MTRRPRHWSRMTHVNDGHGWRLARTERDEEEDEPAIGGWSRDADERDAEERE